MGLDTALRAYSTGGGCVSGADAPRTVAALTVVAGVASAASVIAGGWLSDRSGRRRVFLLVASAAIVAGDGLLLASPTVPAAFGAAALFGVGLGLAIACGRALASQVLPDPDRGAATGIGLLNTAANVGQAAAPAVGAAAIGLGGYPAAFMVSLAGAVLCSVAVLFVRSVR